MQLEYLEYTTRYVNSIDADAASRDVLARWNRRDGEARVRSDRSSTRELDWVIKRQWIEKLT